MDASHKTSCHWNQSKCREHPTHLPDCRCFSFCRIPGESSSCKLFPDLMLHNRLIEIGIIRQKKKASDKYIDGFFKIHAPELVDRYWPCSVLRRALCCCFLRRYVFWCQATDRGGRCIRSDTVPLVGERHTLPATAVINSYYNVISARPYAPKWISNGWEMAEWHPCSQSIVLLQLRNPAG